MRSQPRRLFRALNAKAVAGHANHVSRGTGGRDLSGLWANASRCRVALAGGEYEHILLLLWRFGSCGTSYPGTRATSAEPARNANVWYCNDHEPVPSQVQKKEQAAGVAPSPEQQQARDRKLESPYHILMTAPRPNQPQPLNGIDKSGDLVMMGRN
jgi:hypothetical protein